jgi:hypothetical protein
MRIALFGLILSLGVNAGTAQGTIRFDWNGNQNQVHGGFEVTPEELYGYTNWGSPVLLNSVSFTDFFGVTMSTTQNPYNIFGGYNSSGWFFEMALTDFSRGVVLHVSGHESMFQDYIAETDLGGIPLGWENGTWNHYWVPEPHTTALLILGLACLVATRKRRRGKCGKPTQNLNAAISQGAFTIRTRRLRPRLVPRQGLSWGSGGNRNP